MPPQHAAAASNASVRRPRQSLEGRSRDEPFAGGRAPIRTDSALAEAPPDSRRASKSARIAPAPVPVPRAAPVIWRRAEPVPRARMLVSSLTAVPSAEPQASAATAATAQADPSAKGAVDPDAAATTVASPLAREDDEAAAAPLLPSRALALPQEPAGAEEADESPDGLWAAPSSAGSDIFTAPESEDVNLEEKNSPKNRGGAQPLPSSSLWAPVPRRDKAELEAACNDVQASLQPAKPIARSSAVSEEIQQLQGELRRLEASLKTTNHEILRASNEMTPDWAARPANAIRGDVRGEVCAEILAAGSEKTERHFDRDVRAQVSCEASSVASTRLLDTRASMASVPFAPLPATCHRSFSPGGRPIQDRSFAPRMATSPVLTSHNLPSPRLVSPAPPHGPAHWHLTLVPEPSCSTAVWQALPPTIARSRSPSASSSGVHAFTPQDFRVAGPLRGRSPLCTSSGDPRFPHAVLRAQSSPPTMALPSGPPVWAHPHHFVPSSSSSCVSSPSFHARAIPSPAVPNSMTPRLVPRQSLQSLPPQFQPRSPQLVPQGMPVLATPASSSRVLTGRIGQAVWQTPRAATCSPPPSPWSRAQRISVLQPPARCSSPLSRSLLPAPAPVAPSAAARWVLVPSPVGSTTASLEPSAAAGSPDLRRTRVLSPLPTSPRPSQGSPAMARASGSSAMVVPIASTVLPPGSPAAEVILHSPRTLTGSRGASKNAESSAAAANTGSCGMAEAPVSSSATMESGVIPAARLANASASSSLLGASRRGLSRPLQNLPGQEQQAPMPGELAMRATVSNASSTTTCAPTAEYTSPALSSVLRADKSAPPSGLTALPRFLRADAPPTPTPAAATLHASPPALSSGSTSPGTMAIQASPSAAAATVPSQLSPHDKIATLDTSAVGAIEASRDGRNGKDMAPAG
eukprot:TRINITY_DN6219_c0_g2_i1.p1 TRINITY_DN6219_c0_g2~~TRINITY_DN6219_c0_g2_i1.p1  ORF type:complete len:920 (+),score=151.93 TRINITY_DN6219_c0_g2_i1:76-2835(+)